MYIYLDVSGPSPIFPPGFPSGSPPRNLSSTADAVDVVYGRGFRGGRMDPPGILIVRRFLTKKKLVGHVTLADGDTSGSATFHILWPWISLGNDRREWAPDTRQGRGFCTRLDLFLKLIESDTEKKMLGSNDRWRVPGGKRKFRQRMERLADDPGDVYRFSIQAIDRSSRVMPYVQNGGGGATIWTTIDIKRWIDRALRAEREFVARRYSNRCRSVISDFISRFDRATGFFFFFHFFFFVQATCSCVFSDDTVYG